MLTIENVRKFEKLTWKLSWSFHSTTGINVKELQEEARYALYEALHEWQGGNSYFIYTSIKNHLINYIKAIKSQETVSIDDYIEGEDGEIQVPQPFIVQPVPVHSQETEKVLQIIQKYIYENSEVVKEKIAQELQEEGMKLRDIWKLMKDLKEGV